MANPVERIPPVIATRRSRASLSVFLLVVAGLVVAKFSTHLHLSFMVCSFKGITGLPCAFCGGTRAFRSLAGFHIVEALRWNPFVTLGALLIIGWQLALLISPRPVNRLAARLEQVRLWPYVIGAVLLNWIYLLFYLPR